VTFGWPKKMRLDQQELARELVRGRKSISAVARDFNVHPATIYRVIDGKGPYATFLFLSAAESEQAKQQAQARVE
jgi:transposase-like protein